ncbi:bifunctional aldolase/short-chain dehydrogenase [Alphaproteobacteria bacterium GH1-50]|uniref:Bifunctional aldolase/short-chain dehydrogenase n=1 Tax=Kangsaoukella pontilimi TaxID=2691042 RepID=A0A7C9IQI2_9RHOB|nr:bifunctional aldolase/short-chain dehydrogenase [Kangsaoukella pontilimi]
MENRWDETDAARWQAEAGDDPADRALALRVYSSRLIGSDPDLVMHGGGNTSIKVTRRSLLGEDERVLHVKGSGWDLDTLLAPGLPGVRLEPLLRLRALDRLSDEDMVNAQRQTLLDSTAPNPSVETLLHAFLPQDVVDHTHATPFLVLANLPDAEAVAREIFGDRLGIVPYIMPGFALAKAAAEVFEANPHVEGLLLLKHGHFTWGPTARESYDRVVRHTNEAAEALGLTGPTFAPGAARDLSPDVIRVLPRLRGALAAPGSGRMPVLNLRANALTDAFLARPDHAGLAGRGTASPDHVIRIKGAPVIVDVSDDSAAIADKVDAFARNYTQVFERQNTRVGGIKTMLSPLPNLAWIEGLGLAGMGANAKAAAIAGDLGEQNMRVAAAGEDKGGFCPIGEDDLFDMEYWSLEQAKLGKSKPPAFQGRIVMVTGGAGAIGRAIAAAFAAEGAEIVLVDRDAEALAAARQDLGTGVTLALDVTDPAAADAAMAGAIRQFGGLDILVSNAGAAIQGALADLDEDTLRAAFELNFFAHQRFAKAAIGVFREQGQGGQILFNVSKQAVNPGRNFGAYGLPKATTFFLLRQLALEHGPEGIRVNGVNADRIRSGLLTEDFIASRAAARGTDPAGYMAGNLLGREVEAHHVADAFVALAKSERTTAHVMTVDGGNIEAALR